MNKTWIKPLIAVTLTLLYNYFFWSEKLGLNLILFSILLILTLLNLSGKRPNATSIILLTGALVTGIMVLWHNSVNAKIAHLVSMVLLAGSLQQPALRSLYYFVVQMFRSLIGTPRSIGEMLPEKRRIRTGKVMFTFKVIIFPLILLGLFYLLFYNGIPAFAKVSDVLINSISDFFEYVFADISFARVMFIISGLFVSASFVLYKPVGRLVEIDNSQDNILKRIRYNYRNALYKPAIAMNDLSKEFRAAMFLLVSVNILLLAVNITDISTIWFNYKVENELALKGFVHEGTWLLVTSILISMVVILAYFRRNLNFYPGNKWLKKLGVLWMMQNLVLGVSVCIRNFWYMEYHGLAYKRIGVLVFLLLTLAGLITMVLKIRNTKSAYFLLRSNSWVAYCVFVLMSFMNWDLLIAKVNVNHWNTHGIDVDFYHQLSPKTLPVIYANLDKIEKQIAGNNAMDYNWFEYRDIDSFKRMLRYRSEKFIDAEENDYSWLSWNKADEDAYAFLKSKDLPLLFPGLTYPIGSNYSENSFNE